MGVSEAASAGKLARSVEEYLAQHPAAALLGDRRMIFDLRRARYSVGESHGRCLRPLRKL